MFHDHACDKHGTVSKIYLNCTCFLQQYTHLASDCRIVLILSTAGICLRVKTQVYHSTSSFPLKRSCLDLGLSLCLFVRHKEVFVTAYVQLQTDEITGAQGARRPGTHARTHARTHASIHIHASERSLTHAPIETCAHACTITEVTLDAELWLSDSTRLFHMCLYLIISMTKLIDFKERAGRTERGLFSFFLSFFLPACLLLFLSFLLSFSLTIQVKQGLQTVQPTHREKNEPHRKVTGKVPVVKCDTALQHTRSVLYARACSTPQRKSGVRVQDSGTLSLVVHPHDIPPVFFMLSRDVEKQTSCPWLWPHSPSVRSTVVCSRWSGRAKRTDGQCRLTFVYVSTPVACQSGAFVG